MDSLFETVETFGPTLWDRFAQAALCGLLAAENPDWHFSPSNGKTKPQKVAQAAADMADAMLAERAKRLEP